MNRREYYLNIARAVAEGSKCNCLQVGCVLVKDDAIIATGMNGQVRGEPNCDCNPNGIEPCDALHAEMNAVIMAALHGNSTKGALAYITHSPCEFCIKVMRQAGIVTFHYAEKYISRRDR